MFGFAKWVSRGNKVAGAALATLSLCWSSQGLAGASGGGEPFEIPQGAYLAEFVEDRDGISVMRFSGNLDLNLADGSLNQAARAVIAQEFYEHHPDIYDFIVVFSSFEYDTGDALAFHIGARNDVQGIGKPQFDLSQSYGSDGRLRGYIDMAAASRYELSPLEPAFDNVLTVLAHETLHNWAAQVEVQKEGQAPSDILLGKDGSHWNFFLDSRASVEYGHRWRDNGDGTFTAVAAQRFFSPLDLYLMGFNTPEEVPGFYVIQPQEGTEFSRFDLSRPGVTVTGTREDFSIQDVIAAEGPRVPAVADAQKTFNFAFIYLVDAQEEARDIDVARIGEVRKAYAERFAILTGGRGIANIFPQGKDAEVGSVEEVGSSDVTGRQDGGNVQAGVEWLTSQQDAQGFWADKTSTRLRDTTAVIETLENLGRSYDRQLAMEWLLAQPVADTDSIARVLLVADAGADATALLEQLKSAQRPDGGWPLKPGLSSDPLDSALSVRALLRHGDMEGVVQAVNYLKSAQLPEGGWPAVAGGAPDLATTLSVADTLLAVNPADVQARQAGQWLVARQNADGGFGTGSSEIHLTAEVIRIAGLLDLQQAYNQPLARQYLADRQSEAGNWGGSIYASAMAARAFRQLEATNLLVDQVAVNPATPRDGELAELRAVVRNDSVLEAGPVSAQFYDGDPENGGVPIGDAIPLGASSPKSSREVSAYWDTTDASSVDGGLHDIYLVVDSTSVLAERNENDNTGSVSVVVQAPVDGVELELDARALAVTPTTTQLLPNSVAVSAVLRNVGSEAAASVTVELWRGDAGSGELQDSQQLAVDGRSTAAVNLVGSISAPGTQAYTLVVDPANEFVEQDKGNNQAVVSVSTEPALDLAVFAEDIAVSPASPFINTDAEFSVGIRNRGTQDSPSVNVRYLVNTGSGVQEIYTSTVAIEAGQTAVQTIPWRVDTIGALDLVVEIDPANDVPELDEDNNSASFSFNTGIQQGTNLVTSYKDIQFSSSPAFEGAGVSISTAVRNTGTEDATSVEVAFYDGDPDASGVLLGTEILPQVTSGESVPVEFLWSEIPGNADRVIHVVVDPQGNIAELDLSDNRAFEKLPVESLPDLAVSGSNIALDPVFPKLNDTVSVNISVVNQGNQAAENVLVELYKEGVRVGDATLVQVAGNSSAVASIPVVFDQQGRQDLRVVIDPANSIRESSTANNEATRQVAIQDGNFYVSEKYLSPEGDGSQDTTEFYFNLPEARRVSVELLDKYDRVARRWEEDFASPVSAGSVRWDGRRQGGSVASDGNFRFVVRGETGDVLGQASVVVDTNRSSLSEAIGTPYGLERNLTCRIGKVLQPEYRESGSSSDQAIGSGYRDLLAYSPDDQYIYFATYLDPYEDDGQTYTTNEKVKHPSGVYRALRDGTQVERILPYGDLDTRKITKLTPSPDGQRLLISTNDNHPGRERINPQFWLVNTVGLDVERMQELTDGSRTRYIGDAVFTKGGERIVYVVTDGTRWSENDYEVYSLDLTNTPYTSELVGVIPDQSRSDTLRLDVNKTGDRVLAHFRGNYENRRFSDFYQQSRPQAYLIDVDANTISGLGEAAVVAWSPEGNRLALAQHVERGVQLLDKDGNLVQEYPLPAQATNDYEQFLRSEFDHKYWGIFRGVTWNPDGSEFAVLFEDHARYMLSGYFSGPGVHPMDAYFDISGEDFSDIGGLYTVDLQTAEVRLQARAAPLPFPYYGDSGRLRSFHISVWDGESWTKIEEVHLGSALETVRLPISEARVDANGQVKVKIQQLGHEEAQIELAALEVGGRLLAPESAVSQQTGRELAELVAASDNRWADVWNQTVEFTWNVGSDAEPRNLVFSARESSPSKLPLVHFSYPDKSGYYEFLLGGGANIAVDGIMNTGDDLGSPAFVTLTKPDTGHPDENVYGYIGSDHKHLKVAVDFTVDTTDGVDDWASVEILTDSGWRTFTLNGHDDTWGAVSFVQTSNAPWEHHYYEFEIPLSEIGKSVGEVIQYRVHAFGSAAGNDYEDYLTFLGRLGLRTNDSGYYFDGETPVFLWSTDYYWYRDSLHTTLEWLPGAREVLLGGYHPDALDGINLISFDQPAASKFIYEDRGYRGGSQAPTLTNTGKFLAMYQDQFDNRCADGESYGFKQFRSLLNGTADLFAVRSISEGGVILRGSAMDKNFASYTLEYSTEAAPDNWRQIVPAAGEPVIDGKFTTWVAPGLGRYNIRLTVKDLAGNVRREIRSIAVSESASIRNVYRQPAYFSPNGDGVQDTAALHFTVAEPVNLLVEVLDSERNVVRQFENSYSDIGADEVILWDGRSDAGQLVPEGEYTLKVQKYEYQVILDVTPPVIDSRVNSLLVPKPELVDGEDSCIPNFASATADICRVELDRKIGAALDDAYGIESFGLEYRRLGEANWSELPVSEGYDEATVVLPGRGQQKRSLGELQGGDYRFVVADYAGNRSTLTVPAGLKRHQLYITGAQLENVNFRDAPLGTLREIAGISIPYLDTGLDARLSANLPDLAPTLIELSSTLESPVASVDVLLDETDGDGKLLGEPTIVTPIRAVLRRAVGCSTESICFEYADPSSLDELSRGSSYLVWDPANAELGDGEHFRLSVRVRGIDGNEFVSNPVALSAVSDIFGIREVIVAPDNPDLLPEVDFFAQAAPGPEDILAREKYDGGAVHVSERVVPAEYDKYVVVVATALPGEIGRVELTGSSEDLPEFAIARADITGHTALRYKFDGGVAGFAYALDASILQECQSYSLRARFYRADNPETAEDESGELLTEVSVNLEVPCVEVRASVLPELSEQCDTASPNRLLFRMKAAGASEAPTPGAAALLSEVDLVTLTLARRDQSTGEWTDVLYNVNEPVFGGEYDFALDTTDFAAGKEEFLVEFVDTLGRDYKKRLAAFIDKTAPEIQIESPGAGDQVCAVHLPLEDETANVVPVSGRIRGDSPMVYYGTAAAELVGTEEPGTFTSGFVPGYIRSGADGTPQSAFTCAGSSGGSVTGQDCAVDVSWPSQYAGKSPVRFPSSGEYVALGSLGVLPTRHSGTLEFHYSAHDWSGIRACRSVEIDVDADVTGFTSQVGGGAPGAGSYVYSGTGYSRVPVFAPLLGNEFSLIRTSFAVEEAVEATLSVYTTQPDPENIEGLSLGELTATPVSGLAALEGETILEFDGRDDGGNPLADGIYLLRLQVTDACGNSRVAEHLVEIDNTAPLASLTYPVSGTPIGLLVDVLGSASDRHLAGYRVEYRRSGDAGYLEIASGRAPVSDAVLASDWNTYGLAGELELRVLVTDIVGHQSVAQETFTVPERTDLISELEVIEPFFSPNGDGVKDTSGIHVRFEQPVLATATVGDTPIVEAVAYEAGIHRIQWDGRLANTVQPDGTYEIVLAVESQLVSGLRQEEQVSLALDNTLPTLLPDNTEGGTAWVMGGESLVGTVNDTHLENYAFTVTDGPSAVGQVVATGAVPVVSGTLLDTGSGPFVDDGEYQLGIAVTDKAGNRTRQEIQLVIDSTPPVARIDDLVSGNFVSGSLQVNGAATDDYLKSYTLQLVGASGGSASLSQGESAVEGELGAWVSTEAPDGEYRLALVAVDFAGHETSTGVDIVVDNTPPEVSVIQPRDGGYLTTEAGFTGTVADSHLKQYELAIAAGSVSDSDDPRFQIQSVGAGNISGGFLGEWASPPQDGPYTLKLSAVDKAGNRNRVLVPFELDTTPPDSPVLEEVNLDKEAQRGDLTWSAVTADDLAGYLVYRNGQAITPQPLEATSFQDENLPEGEYQYYVVAVDQAGNASQPSNALDLVLDLTPPDVWIASPAADSVVSGLVNIRGTAHSATDFRAYRVYVEDAQGNATLLVESSLSLSAEELAQWDTLSLKDPAGYTIRLEAEDTYDNVGSVSVRVFPDNLAPPAPQNLQGTLSGSDVSLTWDALAGVDDLAGYLVFRGEQLLGASDITLDALLPYARMENSAADNDLVDGTYVYSVYAIDTAGNISEPSEPAEVSVDTGAPQAVIVSPAVGSSFEFATELTAEVNANDVANVRFEYRASGDTQWLLAGADSREPFTISWDTSALAYGAYELRAVATDTANNTDPDPAMIAVSKADLMAPPAVASLDLSVDGGTVSLEWPAVEAEDLAGYHIYRSLENSSSPMLLTATPVSGVTYLDQGVADNSYRYHIVAVDMAGNEADPSPEASATVFTPVVNTPWTPTSEASVAFHVETLPGHDLTLERFDGGTWVSATNIPTGDAGTVDIPDFALASGENQLRFTVVSSEGNRGKPVSRRIYKAPLPSAVNGVEAVESSSDGVDVSWLENDVGEEIFGYRLFRDGAAVDDTYEPFVAAVTAEPNNYYTSFAPTRAVNDNYSQWRPTELPVTLELGFDERHLFTQVDVRWFSPFEQSSDYALYGWDGADWTLLYTAQNTSEEPVNQLVLERPYLTDRLKIEFRKPRGFDAFGRIRLEDIDITAIPVVAGAQQSDPEVSRGEYAYQVSAVNTWGLEGPLSDPAEITMGDFTAPEPVVLSGVGQESSVQLSWTASVSADVNAYTVERNDVQVASASGTSLAYTDPDLANGTYRYRVFPVDTAGNVGAASNAVDVVVNVSPLGAPVSLRAVNDETTGNISLSWQPAPGTTPASYTLFRSLESGTGYSEVTTTPEQDYLDRDVQSGTTYFYVVKAVDSLGNQGLASEEVSVTSLDTQIGDTHILMPDPSLSHTLRGSAVGVSGTAEPGANVFLMKDGEVISESPASALEEYSQIAFEEIYSVVTGFDGSILMAGQDINSEAGYFLYANGVWRMLDGEEISSKIGNPVLDGGEIGDEIGNPVLDGEEIVGEIGNPDTDEFILLPGGILIRDYFSGALYRYDLQADTVTRVTQGELSDLIDIRGYIPRLNALVLETSVFAANKYLLLYLDDFSLEPLPLLGDDSLAVAVSGERILYTYEDPDSVTERWSLYSYEVESGENRFIAGIPESRSARVYMGSNDKHALVESTNIDTGSTDTFLVNIEDSSLTELMPEFANVYPLGLSLDAGRATLATYDGSRQQNYLLDIDSGEMVEFNEDCYWTSIGALCTSYPYASLLPETGSFHFSSQPLQLGENLFTAFAMDATGNLSTDSETLVVNRKGRRLGDLVVSLTPSPTILNEGNSTSVNLTVGNEGEAGTLGTSVQVVAVFEDGVFEEIGDVAIAPLPVGTAVDYSLNWQPRNTGSYQVIATVDPDLLVEEASELNNTSLATVDVIGQAGPLLALELYGSQSAPYQFSADTGISGQLKLVNGGPVLSGELKLSVVDAQGYPVSTLYFESLDGLPFGGAVEQDWVWDTGSTWAGDYKLVASLLPAGGTEITDEVAFGILPDTEIVSGISSGASSYRPDESVRLTSVLRNAGSNQVFGGGRLRVSVTDSTGAQVFTSEREVGEIMPAGQSVSGVDWAVDGAPAGTYTAALALMEGAAVVSQAQTRFTVRAAAPVLEGVLELPVASLPQGDAIEVSYTVRNASNSGAPATSILVEMTNVTDGGVADTATAVFNVDSGSVISNQASLSGDQSIGSYQVVLKATFVYEGVTYSAELARGSVEIVDGEPPEVSLVYPAEGAVVKGVANHVRLRATDSVSGVELVEASLNDGDWKEFDKSETLASEYLAPLAGLPDGDYSLQGRAADGLGNLSDALSATFSIDNTPPSIAVSGVDDGVVYNAAVSPEVQVTDLHLVESSLMLNGASFTSGSPVEADGEYLLEITGRDQADNFASRIVLFQVDTTPAQIFVEGITDGASYNTAVAPVVTVTDAGETTLDLSLNGQPFESGSAVAEEGSYLLEATAVDLAGNLSQASWQFTLDLTPPAVPLVVEPASGATVDTDLVTLRGTAEAESLVSLSDGTQVRVTHADDQGVFEFADVPLTSGANTFSLWAEDNAGNRSDSMDYTVTYAPAAELSLTAQLVTGKRVLVWLPERDIHKHPSCLWGEHHGHDPFYAHYGHDTEALNTLVGAALEEAGFDYLVVRNVEEFRAQLRGQQFGSILVGAPHVELGLGLILNGEVYLEVRGAVAAGTGLTVVSTHPGFVKRWSKLFGGRLKGSLDEVDALELDGDFGTLSGNWSPSYTKALQYVPLKGGGRGRLKYGCVAGGKCKSVPGVIFNQYAEGKVALVPFNPAALPEDVMKAFIGEAVEYTMPAKASLVPGGIAESKWTLSEVSPPMHLALEVDLVGDGLWTDIGNDGEIFGETARWLRYLEDSSQTHFSGFVGLTSDAGKYQLNGRAIAGSDFSLPPSDTAGLEFEVYQSSAELGNALIHYLEALDVRGFQHFFRNIAIAKVKMALSVELREKSDAERAMHWLLGAIAIADILESEELDRRIGELLKVYQAAWARLPNAAGPRPPGHPWQWYRDGDSGEAPGFWGVN
ncbi:CARDB domain-containing protein [Microbulbifer sp.]|uniref:CARDB domain-containing protein n=1 Tax=Microbulbifer sp. TaxID=1908541 RepID=UPI003F3110D1